MRKLTVILCLTLAVLVGSEGAYAHFCPKETTLVSPYEMAKQERTVRFLRSETTFRSDPGVPYCRFHDFGKHYQNKKFRMIGRFENWRLLIVDGKKGWVHKLVLSPKTYISPVEI